MYNLLRNSGNLPETLYNKAIFVPKAAHTPESRGRTIVLILTQK